MFQKLAIALAATTIAFGAPSFQTTASARGFGVEAILVAAEPTSVAASPVSVAGLATMGGDTTEDASLVMALARSAWVWG